jgi:hypothetical protein
MRNERISREDRGFDVVVVAVVTTCGKRLGKVWIQEERQPSTHLSGYRFDDYRNSTVLLARLAVLGACW